MREATGCFAHVFLSACIFLLAASSAGAEHTPVPSSVTIAGNLQSELGCPGDWQPDCAASHLAFDAEDDVWQGAFTLPIGFWDYKAALNDSWDENYGLNAELNGPNIPLTIPHQSLVKFYYDHKTHWATDNQNSVIAIAPGSFQSELGCSGDWDPSCLRSWLQDPDGDGIFTFQTKSLPAGSYEVKVALNESWDINFGAGGVQNGPNIPFTVPADCVEMLFAFDDATKILTVSVAPPGPQPASVTVPGNFQSELGCPGDWQPDCAATHLMFDAEDTVWQESFTVPMGFWEYKATLNDSWDENYGSNATLNGPNIPLNLSHATLVKFYYDHETHWVTDDHNSVIAVAPGSFQSEIGCSGDWQPWCLRSWLQDPDGDGIFTFSAWLPAGNYEVKVAHNESWDENYGDGGVQNGPNIPFSVPQSCTEMFFTYNPVSHILTVDTGFVPEPGKMGRQSHHIDPEAWLVRAFTREGSAYLEVRDMANGLVPAFQISGLTDNPKLVANDAGMSDISLGFDQVTRTAYVIYMSGADRQVAAVPDIREVICGVKSTYYPDADGDGFGDPNTPVQACSQPGEYLTDNSDCDDGDNEIYPGSPEVCDNKANDCDRPGAPDGADETWLGTVTACGIGVCSDTGQLVCAGGVQDDTCAPGAPTETPEISCFDNRDNDCDGDTDGDDGDCPVVSDTGKMARNNCYLLEDGWLVRVYTASTGPVYEVHLAVVDTVNNPVPASQIQGLQTNPLLIAADAAIPDVSLTFDFAARTAYVIYTTAGGRQTAMVPGIE